MYSVLEGALFYIFNFASLRCSIKRKIDLYGFKIFLKQKSLNS